MIMQRIPSTEVNHRMRQIRQFASSDGLVVLTSHDKPALIILDVGRCLQLLYGAEQLVKLLAANNLVEDRTGSQCSRHDRIKPSRRLDQARLD